MEFVRVCLFILARKSGYVYITIMCQIVNYNKTGPEKDKAWLDWLVQKKAISLEDVYRIRNRKQCNLTIHRNAEL